MIGPFVSAVGANLIANGMANGLAAPVKSSPLPPKKAPTWRNHGELQSLGGGLAPLSLQAAPAAPIMGLVNVGQLAAFVPPVAGKGPSPSDPQPLGCDSCGAQTPAGLQISPAVKLGLAVLAFLVIRKVLR